jgi:putative two-component system response regulator
MANDKKLKVFLIDDDDIHLTTAELFLKDEYEIHKAHSGKEALDYINDNNFIPNLILLDIVMPDMNGWEVFKRMRETGSLKNVPIAFLTSIAEEEERKKAYRIGVADYIMKPFNMTELKARIKEIIRKYRI